MPASELVTKKILHYLLSGKTVSGEKLPTAEFFAREAGVSILTARESINNLQMIGLVEIIHGKGIFVTKGQDVIDDLFDAREFYECNNAVAAASRTTKLNHEEFESILNQMATHAQTGNINEYIQRHADFHRLIAVYANNRILFRAFENMRKLFLFQMELLNTYRELSGKSLPQHMKIYEHIKNKNPELAKSAMAEHLRETRLNWKKCIAKEPFLVKGQLRNQIAAALNHPAQ